MSLSLALSPPARTPTSCPEPRRRYLMQLQEPPAFTELGWLGLLLAALCGTVSITIRDRSA